MDRPADGQKPAPAAQLSLRPVGRWRWDRAAVAGPRGDPSPPVTAHLALIGGDTTTGRGALQSDKDGGQTQAAQRETTTKISLWRVSRVTDSTGSH